jgi:hypothetical protein
MKELALILVLFVMSFMQAQTVGINTDNPRSLLDIPAQNSTSPFATDGLLPVRVSSFPSIAPGLNQNALWTYNTNNRQNYWWDNSWTMFESFRNTLDQAYDNNGFGQGRFIFADSGGVSIEGDGLYVTGSFGNGNTLNLTGGDTNLIFYPKTGSFIKSDELTITTTTEFDYNVIFGEGYNDAQFGARYATIFGATTSANADESVCLGRSYSGGFRNICLGYNSINDTSSILIGNSGVYNDYGYCIGQNSGDRTSLIVIGNNNSGVSSGVFGDIIGIGNNNSGIFNTAPPSRHYFIGSNNTFSNGLGFVIGNDNAINNGLILGHHLVSDSRDQISIGFYNTSYTPDPEPTNGQQPDNRLLVFGNGTSTQPSDALVMLEDGRTGIGQSFPKVTLQIKGGFSSNPSSVTATSSSQTITVGNTFYLKINSNSLPGSRTIILSDGLVYGQLLTIECTASGSFGIRLNNGGNMSLSSTNLELTENDTLRLIWLNSWRQIGYSNN